MGVTKTTDASRKVNEVRQRMEKQRKATRKEQRNLAKGKRLEVEGVTEELPYGVDERGRKVDLKADIHGWETVLGFKRELVAEMGTGFKEGERIPRGKVSAGGMDIYRAVRSLKHIRQAHAREIAQNERLFKSIDELQAMLNVRGHAMDCAELARICAAINAHIEEVSKKTSGYKLLARWKLERVPAMLEGAGKEREDSLGTTKNLENFKKWIFKKRNLISKACALLVAFKERYGKWRERQIFRMDRYEIAREGALRQIRDERLKNLLMELAGKLDSRESAGAAFTLAADWEIIRNLRKAQKCLSRGEFEDALALVEESGRLLKSKEYGGESEKLRRILGQPYLFIKRSMKEKKNGWRAEARCMLEHFCRYLGQRNTRYIIQEMKKTNDKYAEGAVAAMENGNSWIRKSLSDSREWMKRKMLRYAASAYRSAARSLFLS